MSTCRYVTLSWRDEVFAGGGTCARCNCFVTGEACELLQMNWASLSSSEITKTSIFCLECLFTAVVKSSLSCSTSADVLRVLRGGEIANCAWWRHVTYQVLNLEQGEGERDGDGFWGVENGSSRGVVVDEQIVEEFLFFWSERVTHKRVYKKNTDQNQCSMFYMLTLVISANALKIFSAFASLLNEHDQLLKSA